MASTREIRRRIRSIGGTAQITKAMQMVAASKMRRAQQAAINVRPFSRLLYLVQRQIATRIGDERHPLLETRPVARRLVIVVSSDKGLCGALNSNVLRLAGRFDPHTTRFVAVGRKAAQFIARTRRELVADFPYGDTPTFAEARVIAGFARDQFLGGDVDEVRIVATRFVNTLTQQATLIELLPIGTLEVARLDAADSAEALGAEITEFRFEPDAASILEYLLGRYLSILVHLVLLNARASEQSARMVSMKSATDNAQSMIKDLTLAYNKLRQGYITQELLEIAGGQAD